MAKIAPSACGKRACCLALILCGLSLQGCNEDGGQRQSAPAGQGGAAPPADRTAPVDRTSLAGQRPMSRQGEAERQGSPTGQVPIGPSSRTGAPSASNKRPLRGQGTKGGRQGPPGGKASPGGQKPPAGTPPLPGQDQRAGGNRAGAPPSSSPRAAPLLGDVARTVVSGTDARSGVTFPVGENIYGPFEAGFGSRQDHILEALGCAQGSLGHVSGGMDTHLAEQMVAYQCGITLPRIEGSGPQGYISLLDECGGHTREYHFHEKLSCLYNSNSGAHSPKVAIVLDGKPLYGKWEHTTQSNLPLLDACGGHYGRTPESPTADVYHYHVQNNAPFTVGCFGPNHDGSLVTVEQCRSFYSGCDGNLVTVNTPQGAKEYDDWCPCFDANGSNTGKNIAPLAAFAAPTPSP